MKTISQSHASELLKLQRYCETHHIKLLYEQQMASTNSHVLSHALIPDEAILCLTDHQTNGRGRNNKTWHSHTPGQITASYLYWPDQSAKQIACVSLVVAVALAEALDCNQCKHPIDIKWPNDLLVQHKKLAGILIEATQHHGRTALVIGFGINVVTPQFEEQQKIQQPFTSINEIRKGHASKLDILTQCLQQLRHALHEFDQQGLYPFIQRYQQRDCLANQRVSHQQHNKTTHGIARGINERGEIIIETHDGKTHQIVSGTIRYNN